MRIVLVVLALAGCDLEQTFESGVDYFTDHGEVFECEATRTTVVELCTELSESDLEKATGWTCEPTSRWWPRVTGCIYRCGADVGPGCNAHAGCFCPEP